MFYCCKNRKLRPRSKFCTVFFWTNSVNRCTGFAQYAFSKYAVLGCTLKKKENFFIETHVGAFSGEK